MKRLLISLALLTAPLAPVLAASDAGTARATQVAVPIGQQKVVAAAGFDRVVLDDPWLAAVNPRGDKELVVTGLKDGTTTLWVYKKEGIPAAYQIKVGTGVEVPPAGPPSEDAGVKAIEGKPVDLKVGAEMLLRNPALQGVAVVDPEIAEVRIVSDTLLVVRGLSAGNTNALVFPRDGGMPTSYPVTVLGAPGGADAGL